MHYALGNAAEAERSYARALAERPDLLAAAVNLGRLRVEHWDTAIQHGRHVANSLVHGPEAYGREPYFFTDQYDLGMEYVGHTGQGGYDDVIIRGDLRSRLFNALWLHEGRVVAGMHVNDWDATKNIRGWVGQQATDALRDTAIPLSDVGN